MCGATFIDWWTSLMGALAGIALVVIGVGLILQKLETTEALKYVAGFVGIAVVLALVMKVLVNFWCGMSFGQHALLFAAAIALWLWRHDNQQRKRKEE